MTTRWEKYLWDKSGWGLLLANIIEDAFDELSNLECPHCNKPIYPPTFEEIQEWLEKEEE